MKSTNMPLLICDPLEEREKVCLDIKKWEPIMARNDRCFCGSGKKQKHCHPDVHESSVYANLLKVISEVEAERTAVGTPKCCFGCHDCCSHYFNISVTEFFSILRHIKVNQYDLRMYLYKARKSLEGLVLPDSNDDRLHIDGYPECIFVNDTNGKCDIYSVRPMVCRLYGNAYKFTDCQKVVSDSQASASLFNCGIDVVSNIDVFKSSSGQLHEGVAHPIIVWLARLSDDGELRAQRMKDLFNAFNNAPISEFTRILMK